MTNAGLRPDDVLILTKPLGVGVITTAIKRGIASAEVIDAAVRSMTFLNGRASRVALDNGATGATDVTGFGLLGHLGRMARESSVDVTIDVARVPLIDGARALAEAGAISGGAMRNVNWVDEQLDRGAVDELTVTLLADPQTSGGLVFGARRGSSRRRARSAREQRTSGGAHRPCPPRHGSPPVALTAVPHAQRAERSRGCEEARGLSVPLRSLRSWHSTTRRAG